MTNAGVEIDWLRQFWDVRTGGSNWVPINSMIGWLNVASWNSITWSTTTAYTILDGRAGQVGGQLGNNWSDHKGQGANGNGINH